MKRILVIISIMFLAIGCKAQLNNKNDFIPYLLPLKTERVIYNKIKTIPKEKHIAFSFHYNGDGTINVYVDIFSKGIDKEHKLTNRKLFINDQFYTLVFNLDETFRAELKDDNIIVEKVCSPRKGEETFEKINIPNLSEREKMFPYKKVDCQIAQKRITSMRHDSPILKMDASGNVVQ